MSSSGRCHGPGCTQTAVVEGGFCGEVCQARWHDQFKPPSTESVTFRVCECGRPIYQHPSEVPRTRCGPCALSNAVADALSQQTEPGPVEVPVTVAVNGDVDRDSAPSIVEAIERAAEMVGEMTYSGTASSVMEDILRAYDLIEAMPAPEPVRLTRSQLDQLREHCPPPREPVPSGAIETLIGHRIELVELEEDSTPYQLGFRRGAVETFEGDGPEFEELPPALDGDSEERVCRTLTLPNGDTELLRRFPEPKGAISRAAYAPDPSRGWLSRVFDRLFGRTT